MHFHEDTPERVMNVLPHFRTNLSRSGNEVLHKCTVHARCELSREAARLLDFLIGARHSK